MLTKKPLLNHHLVGIRTSLQVMKSLGYDARDCLRDTGIEPVMLEDSSVSDAVSNDTPYTITLAQEFKFYRNVLKVSADPLIGLKIGKAFRYESYGLLGYAMMSAQTLRDTIAIAADFSVLTFSHFTIQLLDTYEAAGIAFISNYELAPDLLQLYCDRDLEAAFTGVKNSGILFNARNTTVKLMHNDRANKERYERLLNCAVEFGHHRNEILVSRRILDHRSPQRDQMASEYCQAQCKMLLSKLGLQGGLIEQVRKILIARPGSFPDINETAKKMNMSVRTLRRNLNKENSNFQKLLDEIRQQLAHEYLASSMSIDRIAELLGYSEAANFSHAFKRWSGIPPSQYRMNCKGQSDHTFGKQ